MIDIINMWYNIYHSDDHYLSNDEVVDAFHAYMNKFVEDNKLVVNCEVEKMYKLPDYLKDKPNEDSASV